MGQCKPIELCTGAYTKEYKEARLKAELSLIGERDRLLIVPIDLNEYEGLIYERLIAEMIHIKALQNSDQLIFKVLAQTEYKIYLCELEIKKRGLFVEEKDRYGNEKVVPNPALKVQKDLLSILKSYFSEIGLSATSRMKLSEIKEEAESNDELNEILQGLRN